MVVIVMESVPPSLRGECSRYLTEVKTGVFIGTLSAKVREIVWERVKARCESGSALIAYSYANEQSFRMEIHGDPRRSIVDIDGLQLMKIK